MGVIRQSRMSRRASNESEQFSGMRCSAAGQGLVVAMKEGQK